ncbi:hypothetical protein EZS27_037743, partial [termite gut metagenome]
MDTREDFQRTELKERIIITALG